MEQQPHRACEWTKSKKNKKKQQQKKSYHIQIDHSLYCSIQSTNNA